MFKMYIRNIRMWIFDGFLWEYGYEVIFESAD